jgi:hypothetical protein
MRLRHVADPDDALRRFTRTERGYVDMVRTQRLDEQLRLLGPLAIRSNTWARGGNLARIALDDGTLLRLWLFWKSDRTLAAIERAFYDDEVGWVVVARCTAGDRLKLFAYKVRVDLAAEDAGAHRPSGRSTR